MRSEDIRAKFLEFFKNRGHAVLPSASLVPENDPTVLFTTAGMQPLVPYLMGAPHPLGKRLVNVQKCVRTQDIEEVGDNTHDTFFEMLGNWSLGDYFKEDAIKWSYELLTSKEEGFGIDPSRFYITVFKGDENAPRDDEAADIWKRIGIPEHRIYYLGADSNWWPVVKGKDMWTGPTGPDTEIFYDVTGTLGDLSHEEFLKADEEQKIVEIWNDVFMAYEKKDGTIVGDLQSKNVDTGAGLERLAMVLQGKNNIFDTDLFAPLMEVIKEQTGKEQDKRAMRIVADHIRTSVFMIADGVSPSNTDQGYILRRLLRRAVRYGDVLGLQIGLGPVYAAVMHKYADIYPALKEKEGTIAQEISNEEEQFRKTLERGMKEFEKIEWVGVAEEEITEKKGSFAAHAAPMVPGKVAFDLYQTYGFPIELTKELAAEKGYLVDEVGFKREVERHQALSRTGAEKKFKGGLADTSEMSVKYHTATHLLHKALRDVLGEHVFQKGSNITPERLRFDFSHPQKMTAEEIKKVEELVNARIQDALPVSYEDLPLEEAKTRGAIGLFEEKYGEKVRVYQIGEGEEKYSLEFCGGPHVKNTRELGHFRILKEEAVAQGIRRIKAVLE
ncbi:MAG: alanine--tRNA ligase [Candidatus Lloydbacteria bacterium RIFCSPHIGHO2_02_FULL_51_22]|uniref:Alanine--tRNA ligase n=2 Tax=Candidatus Lloydiibacteriota TaxID=1817910 RepID=A0A1G2DH30_9BACT|nr:MAG: alanine--tRNA ligase [Candidatus Lloydbacteria bacterium RIFCSPHIGHO2_02_FULL_51_22]OGZ14805.1 MAG: alanine--tRNA ligase [Candidatus Lloydbacteria bacterium RIFCSPLOWO2_02_FULL_51_11]